MALPDPQREAKSLGAGGAGGGLMGTDGGHQGSGKRQWHTLNVGRTRSGRKGPFRTLTISVSKSKCLLQGPGGCSPELHALPLCSRAASMSG